MFGRKPGNRRKKRQKHILDVKVHSDYQTHERVQKVFVFLTVIIVLGLVSFGVYCVGKFTTRKFFHENPRFAITRVEVETDGHLSHDQIIGLAGLRTGQSVFAVDLQQVKRDLELDPLIERAEVGRELPNRIHITVNERVPLAQICVQPFGTERKSRLTPIVFFVDKYGVVMQSYALKSPKPLPALIGIRLADLRVGKPIQAPQVFAALQLIKEMELSRVGVRFDMDRIDMSRTDMLTIYTRNGETVSFNPKNISKGLRRLGLILADAERNRLALNTVDLTVEQNVPVTFRPLDDGKARNL
ncbi:MAG: FtsQ-type POTRA domain-containing protein [Verrucomicrobiae bacterium]|nr:FtsQ-type POTRA domain-containing protein [Verrucomicrobiae bacterium]